ncbi:protein POLR1D-like [Onychomys torridus]|nr:protein POLR1D-like [Onychomys torridus]
MKCPLAGTNKRFLINTIKNTLPSHKEQDHEQKEGNKEPGQSQDQKETSSKTHRSHSSKRSLHSPRGSVGHSPPRKRSSRDKRDARGSRR